MMGRAVDGQGWTGCGFMANILMKSDGALLGTVLESDRHLMKFEL
jgi:hypothetical protein